MRTGLYALEATPRSGDDEAMKENLLTLKGSSTIGAAPAVHPLPLVDPSDLFLPPTQPIDVTELISQERS